MGFSFIISKEVSSTIRLMTSSESDRSRYFMMRSTSRRGFWESKRDSKSLYIMAALYYRVHMFSVPLSCPHRRGTGCSSSLSPSSNLSHGRTTSPMPLQRQNASIIVHGNRPVKGKVFFDVLICISIISH